MFFWEDIGVYISAYVWNLKSDLGLEKVGDNCPIAFLFDYSGKFIAFLMAWTYSKTHQTFTYSGVIGKGCGKMAQQRPLKGINSVWFNWS